MPSKCYKTVLNLYDLTATGALGVTELGTGAAVAVASKRPVLAPACINNNVGIIRPGAGSSPR
jgi:hypothetical protein